MKVPVFLVVRSAEVFPGAPSSDASLRDRTIPLPSIPIDRFAPHPGGFTFDEKLQINTLRRRSDLRADVVTGSDDVSVPGMLDVDSIADIPHDVNGHDVLSDPVVDTYATCFDDVALGTAADVATRLDLAALHNAGLDGEGVAIAVVDTGINITFLERKLGFRPQIDTDYSWRPPGLRVEPGEFPVGHGTMCAYAALMAAPKATLIDIPAFVGTPAGGAVIGRRLSLAYQGIAQLAAYWSIAFTPSGAHKYKALVLNNSWGMYHPSWDFPRGHPGRYSDNPRHVFTRNISAMSRIDNVDIVFAAGNCGSDCPDEKCQHVTRDTITGANASIDVLTVAACNVVNERVGYSSQGPGIAGMASSKPDLAAYAHFLGSEALGEGQPDKGTSTAAPVTAGCVAALRTRLDPTHTPPAVLNETLRRTAHQVQGTGWNADTGRGIINPLAAALALELLPIG